MSPPDRQLRRLVLRLSAMHEEDRNAILNHLEVAQRKLVTALLEEIASTSVTQEKPAPAVPRYDWSKLSPWLVEILENERPKAMTETAHQALRRCARGLFPIAEIETAKAGNVARFPRPSEHRQQGRV